MENSDNKQHPERDINIDEEDLPPADPPANKRRVLARFRQAFQRARERHPAKAADLASVRARAELTRDKTKTLFAMIAAIVALLIVFLGLFSSSHEQVQREQAARRGKPNLGRPETAAVLKRQGSVTPMLNAEMSGQEPASDEVTPEDVNNTSRQKTGELLATAVVAPTASKRRSAANPSTQTDAYAPRDIPFSDPALEAYSQQLAARSAMVQPAARETSERAAAVPSPSLRSPAHRDDGLSKSSIVFVSTSRRAAAEHHTPRAAGLDRFFASADVPDIDLPAGTRLIARLQTAVTTAVKTPVLAVIETHYERYGEIVIPAGSRAVGELQGASRNGIVNIRFQELRLASGEVLRIEAAAIALNFGPLKGQVTGTNRGKRFLARALTGVGTIAAYTAGRPGGLALSGPLDNSILLRERVAQNIGIAGEQELMNLAYTQDIVVTVPGNTRFFIVLQHGAAAVSAAERKRAVSDSDTARSDLPTSAELRELISLKRELTRLYERSSTGSTAAREQR